MAEELLGLAVVGERDAAIGAFRHIAALRALEGGGVTAPVQEQNYLFAFFETLSDRFFKLLREDLGALLLSVLLAHIHDPDDGHLLIVNARGHFKQSVFALLHIVETFHGRGG